MGEMVYVPLGEFKPDLRYFGNDGLVRALNVVPVYGNYVSAPSSYSIATVSSDGQEFGLHVHKVTGDGYAAVNVAGAPAKVHLYQVQENTTVTDRSRAAFYNNLNDFYGCSYGPYVVMTNYDDPVQFRDGSGSSNFADAITTTFAPQAKYCFPLRQNLFLANCYLTAGYDGLSSGANPTLVAWSRSDDLRQFGSFNADPQIIGSGYQSLNFDIGEITGAIGADDYGIIAHSDGLVRVDGPPYSFRVLSSECGCIHPYSLVRAQGDVYFWGPGGLTRLRGGDGLPEVLGAGKFRRSLLDNVTGFFEAPWQSNAKISMAYDAVNDLLLAAYRSPLDSGGWAQTYLAYNIGEDRASYCHSPVVSAGSHRAMHYLRSGRTAAIGVGWGIGNQIRFLTGIGTAVGYRNLALDQIPADNPVVMQKGYIQFKREQTTRIVRIRPIYSATSPTAVEHVSVSIDTINKPYDTPTTYGPYSTADSHGWIITPTTVFGDWHSPTFTFASSATMYKVVEFEAFEAEVSIGPNYSA